MRLPFWETQIFKISWGLFHDLGKNFPLNLFEIHSFLGGQAGEGLGGKREVNKRNEMNGMIISE